VNNKDNWEQWKEKVITPFIDSEQGKNLIDRIKSARELEAIYPAPNEIFNAFLNCPIDNIKIVLIGLDPYNKGNHAHGLSFSSKQPNTPPSLRIIFKELRRDLYSYMTDEQWKRFFPHNNLTNWAKRGMLLLNRYLTVKEGEAKSHATYGWDDFQKNHVFSFLNNYDKPLVFILWGNDAQELEPWIQKDKHLILKGAHPAADLYNPAQPKFAGCNHFSKTIRFLKENRPEDKVSIDHNLEKYFNSELFEDFKKLIQSNCYPYNYNSDEQFVSDMIKGLNLSYNYGFDFTLTK
jgi:uracil-DNA glycosylase